MKSYTVQPGKLPAPPIGTKGKIMTNNQKSIADLEAEVRQALAAHDEAKEAERVAQRNATATLNRLNEAQKAFDAAVAELRSNVKSGDWTRQAGFRPTNF